MTNFMARYTEQTYALFRMVTGFLLLCHGGQKLLSFPLPAPEHLPPLLLYGAGPIELVGGSLVLLGLLAPWAAFVCSGMTAAAYWLAHGTHALFPIVNRGELAALYCFAFLFISSKGSGIWSLDAVFRK